MNLPVYSEADLVSFGQYLLSDARRKRIVNGPRKDEDGNKIEKLPVNDRLRQVYDADLERWRMLRNAEQEAQWEHAEVIGSM